MELVIFAGIRMPEICHGCQVLHRHVSKNLYFNDLYVQHTDT